MDGQEARWESPRIESNRTVKNVDEMISDVRLYYLGIHIWGGIAQSSSERLQQATDGSGCRDPQPNIRKRLGTTQIKGKRDCRNRAFEDTRWTPEMHGLHNQ